ncbi:MAG TPA: SDR family oxidoreductase, partial [Anaerolineae bacterium]|nr:SDR family oxidoreductase [Anaerolineae bacterium]
MLHGKLITRMWRLLDTVIDVTVVLSYSNTGYRFRRATLWNEADLAVDLSGKACVITGANSGIGLAAAQQLARRGATIYLLARNMERGVAARDRIIEEAGHSHVYLEAIDLSSIASITACAERIKAQTSRLDILINNAGDAFERRELSVDGVERTLATNVLGPFVLTNALIPLLRSSAPARIINVSSGGMYLAKLDLNDLQFEHKHYDELMAYARSKRALMMLTELWTEQLQSSDVTVNCMHPGWVDTPLLQTGLPVFRQTFRSILRTPDEGADTIVWLAAAPQLAGMTGRFWFDRRERAAHKVFL